MQIFRVTPGPLDQNLHSVRISGAHRSIEVLEAVVSGTLLLEDLGRDPYFHERQELPIQLLLQPH